MWHYRFYVFNPQMPLLRPVASKNHTLDVGTPPVMGNVMASGANKAAVFFRSLSSPALEYDMVKG